MTDPSLPQNVYRLAQKKFNAIPGNPWVYLISDNIRALFINLPNLREYAKPWVGLQTSDNVRFLRFWWEVGITKIGFGFNNTKAAQKSKKRWFPHMKGGEYLKWYGNQDYVVNWFDDGREMKAFGELLKTKVKSPPGNGPLREFEYYFKHGLTWTHTTGKGLNVRLMSDGFICNVEGMACFPSVNSIDDLLVLALLNSSFAHHAINMMNPTIHFGSNEVGLLPFHVHNLSSANHLQRLAAECVYIRKGQAHSIENNFDFLLPPILSSDQQNLYAAQSRLSELESQIDDEIYLYYNISDEDRRAIEFELAGGEEDKDEGEENLIQRADDDEGIPQAMDSQELTIRWISYAIGVILGRFRPGIAGSLGSAIYHREDFAVGTLSPPEEVEFDELVRPAKQFAFVDENGGRHVFSQDVENVLQNLAVPDGIAVFDEGHSRDLPALVEKALNMMLGEDATREVIREATGENSFTSLSADLRKFLEKEFFTGWHFKWYRKRPIYWPIQSSNRSYGFVIFHEKITRDTFYAIQREPYLDTKRNAVTLQMTDLQTNLSRATGTARKKLEKELNDLRKLSDELAEFAKELEAITMGGYEPEPEWIDDGVILRMAPLWKVIPIWKSEPKKYWGRLEAGDYDWSHIAMKYWPDRVREKCTTNKSYAIAHGHEEWYEGK